MVRVWAKIMKGEKIARQTVFEKNEAFDIDNFYSYVCEICNELDISTPIILTKHIFHYVAFNNSCFTKDDFTEEIDFDKFILEEASLK